MQHKAVKVTRTWRSRDDSAARSRESYLKDPEKSHARTRESYMKDPEKSHADSAARSCESYLKDLQKSRADSAARSRESYLKDPEKSHADSAVQSRESYKKDSEKSCDDSAARSRESYFKEPEKSRAQNRESEGSGKELCWQCSMKPRKLQEGLGEVAMTVLHGAMRVTWRILRKVVYEPVSYMKDLEKSHADSAARSRESYKKDL